MAAPAAAATNTSQTNLSPLAAPPPPPPQQQHQQPQTTHQPSSSLSPPPSHPASVSSTSPSKTSLTNWWKGFKSKPLFRKGEEQEHPPKGTPPAVRGDRGFYERFRTPLIANNRTDTVLGIFGVSLNDSIEYAYVNISITNPSGNSEVYGRIPIIVAKCGVYLKERATDVEGIFRVNGSAKRIKELQSFFDSPPTYGKTLDWDGFNVHDAANVFRRYINHLPESIIPHDYYFAFRKPLEVENPDVEQTIRTYQKVIGELPKLNGQLLLYILDLLAVFAENSAQNLMPATNLAAIFQPGLISHPDHDMDPQQYKGSQEVLIFLIEHQDRFLPTSATQPRDKSPRRPPPPEKVQQPIAPPAKYSGTHPPKDTPQQQTNIPRRRTMPKKPEGSSFPTNVLRRHRSNRTPTSPKLTVEEEEPRRVSEGSAPSNTGDDDRRPSPRTGNPKPPDRSLSFEKGRDDVLSSPVIQSALPTQTEQSDEATPVTETTEADVTETPHTANHIAQPALEINNIVEVTEFKSNDDTKGSFLAVSSVPMGRSSSYKEELDEIIDYGDQMTSADVTEAETSDGASKSEKKQKRRISRLPLPWSSNPDLPGESKESKVSNLFSFATSPVGDDGKPTKKLQKKRRPKETEGIVNAIDLAVGIGRPGIVSTPASELSQSERGLGTLSPQPWLHQSNISQSSLNASELSRRSHVSSNRSSVENPRAATPLDRRLVSLTPTTFEEIRQRNLQNHDNDDDLPTKVIMPAAREDRPRASSQSSNTSAGSSSKGSKIGAWLRKKRGLSVSSSTSVGGGGGVVSD